MLHNNIVCCFNLALHIVLVYFTLSIGIFTTCDLKYEDSSNGKVRYICNIFSFTGCIALLVIGDSAKKMDPGHHIRHIL